MTSGTKLEQENGKFDQKWGGLSLFWNWKGKIDKYREIIAQVRAGTFFRCFDGIESPIGDSIPSNNPPPFFLVISDMSFYGPCWKHLLDVAFEWSTDVAWWEAINENIDQLRTYRYPSNIHHLIDEREWIFATRTAPKKGNKFCIDNS